MAQAQARPKTTWIHPAVIAANAEAAKRPEDAIRTMGAALGEQKAATAKAAVPRAHRVTKPPMEINVEDLKVDRMRPELATNRRGAESKYTKLAATLKAGDLVRCERHKVSALFNALSGYYRRNRPDLLVILRGHTNLTDGGSGVEVKKLGPKPGWKGAA